MREREYGKRDYGGEIMGESLWERDYGRENMGDREYVIERKREMCCQPIQNSSFSLQITSV